MSKYIGRLMKVGIGKETVRGAGAIPLYTLPFAKLTFDDKTVQARSNGALGALADSEEAFVTTKYGQGDLDAEIRAKTFGLILYAMLGGYSVTGPIDSAYTHSFPITQSNQHQSLSLVAQDSNTTELYKLVMLDSLKVNVSLDKVATYTAGFFSKTARDTGLTVPAVVHESKFTKKHVTVKLADTIAALAAASPVSVKALNLTINKNVKIDDVIGTAEPEDILNNQLAVEGDLELNYESETFKQYMLNGSYKCMEIDFINGDDTIGVSQHPAWTLQFPKVDFHSWAPSYDLDKIVTQKISFKMSRDVANTLDIISLCQLTNDVPTY